MTDRDTEPQDHDETGSEGEPERPAQAAALHGSGGEGDETPQDATDDTRWDTEEHSDAPGPTGTG
jgi:hypothetical protein